MKYVRKDLNLGKLLWKIPYNFNIRHSYQPGILISWGEEIWWKSTFPTRRSFVWSVIHIRLPTKNLLHQTGILLITSRCAFYFYVPDHWGFSIIKSSSKMEKSKFCTHLYPSLRQECWLPGFWEFKQFCYKLSRHSGQAKHSGEIENRSWLSTVICIIVGAK